MKQQSSIEFLTIYGFVFLIIILVLGIIYLLTTPSTSILPSQCNTFGGIGCLKIAYSPNTLAGNANVMIEISNAGGAPINAIGINVIITGKTYKGGCNPQFILPGGDSVCWVTAPLQSSGSQVKGSFVVDIQYCGTSISQFSQANCTYTNIDYTGSFLVYASYVTTNAFWATPMVQLGIQSLSIQQGLSNFATANTAKGTDTIEIFSCTDVTCASKRSIAIGVNSVTTNLNNLVQGTYYLEGCDTTYTLMADCSEVYTLQVLGPPFTYTGSYCSNSGLYNAWCSLDVSSNPEVFCFGANGNAQITPTYTDLASATKSGSEVADVGTPSTTLSSCGVSALNTRTIVGGLSVSSSSSMLTDTPHDLIQNSASGGTPYTLNYNNDPGGVQPEAVAIMVACGYYACGGAHGSISFPAGSNCGSPVIDQQSSDNYETIYLYLCNQYENTANSVTVTMGGPGALVIYEQGFENGAWATSTPPSLLYSEPVTLTNGQASATGSNFQQLITVCSSCANAYTPSLDPWWTNVEFTTGPRGSGTVLNAWVQDNPSNAAPSTDVWVNLGSSGVGAGSSSTIYMNMMSSGLMSSSGPTGEAPQLSGTSGSSYGAYDNGGSVFSNYWNFASSLSGWTDAEGTVYANDGLQLSSTVGGSYSPALAYYSSPFTTTGLIIADGYAQTTSNQWAMGWGESTSVLSCLGNSPPSGGPTVDTDYTLYPGYSQWQQGGQTGGIVLSGVGSPPCSYTAYPDTYNTGLLGFYWANRVQEAYYNNNIILSSADGSVTTSTTNYLFVTEGDWAGTMPGPGITGTWYYMRTRQYPPGGVMPSVSFS
ncbi:MAG: hypothetical protein KGH62_00470 [Candidatus Micrarchaeota archaeon]|nr:hypothetical protein [Candidatus Micrarchaeota archaeon]